MQVDKDLKKLAKRFNAQLSAEAYDNLAHLQKLAAELSPEDLKARLGLKRKPSSSPFKSYDDKALIYPNYFAPVVVFESGQRLIKPMRYRVRPAGSAQEIPSKYNVFNARLDSLEKRRTWQGLFMQKHALFPFVRFYEWVEGENGKSQLIRFNPGDREIMWAPALYDTWQSKDGSIKFDSFALITDDPPPEVLAQGHDRCPIFLKEDVIDQWLQPAGLSKEQTYSLLKQIETVTFTHSWAA